MSPDRPVVPAGTAGGAADDPPRLRLAAGTRRLGPSLLVGGVPTRLLRLSPAGVAVLEALLGGAEEASGSREVSPATGAARAPVTTAAAERLASRLVSSGLACPCPPAGPELRRLRLPSAGLVIPVRDDPEGLARTLASLVEPGSTPELPVLVVDDGSREPGAVAAVVARWPGVRLLRRPVPGGPAAARNDGWHRCDTELVAFLDAGCVAVPGWLPPLAWHLCDPAVAAVAPRIASRPIIGLASRKAAGRIARYEEHCSPLDLGPDPGPVGPGRPISYVPTTALLVRRQALLELGGLDESLRFGEDVDLVWQLGRAGWSVLYEPSVMLSHPPRSALGAFCRQRAGYASAAGPLDRRHPGAPAPFVATAGTLTPLVLALALGPAPGLAAFVLTVARLDARLGARQRYRSSRGRVADRVAADRVAADHLVAPRLVVLEQFRMLALLDRAGWSAWLPLTLAFVTRLSLRRAAASTRWALPLVVALGPTVEWLRDRPRLDLPSYVILRRVDGLATAAGLWAGALRARRLGPLLPRLVHRDRARA